MKDKILPTATIWTAATSYICILILAIISVDPSYCIPEIWDVAIFSISNTFKPQSQSLTSIKINKIAMTKCNLTCKIRKYPLNASFEKWIVPELCKYAKNLYHKLFKLSKDLLILSRGEGIYSDKAY